MTTSNKIMYRKTIKDKNNSCGTTPDKLLLLFYFGWKIFIFHLIVWPILDESILDKKKFEKYSSFSDSNIQNVPVLICTSWFRLLWDKPDNLISRYIYQLDIGTGINGYIFIDSTSVKNLNMGLILADIIRKHWKNICVWV